MLYSPSTRGFYTPEIHGDQIPPDATAVDDADYEALLQGQSAGKEITVDTDGRPCVTDIEVDPAALLAFARSDAKSAYLRWIADFTAPLTAQYPRVEQDMWPLKLPAARAIVAGTATPDDEALFVPEARLANTTVQACAAATVAKGNLFAQLASGISGIRQSSSLAIDTAETPADAYAALEHAQAEIVKFATSLGLQPTQKGA